MRIFLVPSHHQIDPDPLTKQGILFHPDLLKNGIWFPRAGGRIETDDVFRADIELARSENEAEYIVALEALAEEAKAYVWREDLAVLSMIWSPYLNRVILPKRVWLTIYLRKPEKNWGAEKGPVLSFSHSETTGRPYRTFLEMNEKPLLDKSEWRRRFIFAADKVLGVD